MAGSNLETIKTPDKLPSVIYLSGGEEFLIERNLAHVISVGVPEETRDFNLDILYASETGAKRILEIARSYPMMAEKRVVVVKDVQKLPANDITALTSYAESPNRTTCLVLINRSKDRENKALQKLRKLSHAIECKPLYENQVVDWIKREVKAKGYSISADAALLLAMQVGTQLHDLNNELTKIYLYLDESREIDQETVSAVAGFRKDFTVFALQNALGERNLEKAQRIYRALQTSQSSQMLIARLTRLFTNILIATGFESGYQNEARLAQLTRMSPYFVRDLHKFKQKYRIPEIENALENLRHVDYALKTFPVDERLLFEQMLIHIVKGYPARSLPYAV